MSTIKILNKINQFINDELVFTAFDVTKALRADGLRINHADVQLVLTTYDLSSVEYVQSVAGWSASNGLQPKTYLPNEADADIKTAFDLALENGETPVPFTTLLESVVADEDVEDVTVDADDTDVITLDDETIVLTIDSRFRCAIPNRIVLSTFKVGDRIAVWYDEADDVTYLVEDSEDDDLKDTVLTVDKSGNLRIPTSYLPSMAGDDEGEVTVSYEDAMIVLK